jgi:hypothetical protein
LDCRENQLLSLNSQCTNGQTEARVAVNISQIVSMAGNACWLMHKDHVTMWHYLSETNKLNKIGFNDVYVSKSSISI